MTKLIHAKFKEIKKAVGQQLRIIREQKSLSLAEAALGAGLNYPNMVYDIERGQSRHLFAIFRLLYFYNKKLQIEIVD